MAKKADWEGRILLKQKERDLLLQKLRERKEFFKAIREKTDL